MENVNRKKDLRTTMLCVFAAFLIYKVFAVLTNSLHINYFAGLVLREIVFFAAALLCAILLRKTRVIAWKAKGWGTGLLVGMFFILSVVWGAAEAISDVIGSGGPTIRPLELALLLAGVAFAGFSEELLFRGLLENAFHAFLGERSVGQIRKAFIFSGLFFGFLHIFNLFTGQALIATLMQVVQASLLGMLFSAIYYRSGRNLWVCAFIHAVYDFSSFLTDGVLLGTSASAEISAAGMAASLLPNAAALLVFLFITRKKKLQSLVQTD